MKFFKWVHKCFTAECHEGATQFLYDNPNMTSEINAYYKAHSGDKIYNQFF